jgi:hypothetical protein
MTEWVLQDETDPVNGLVYERWRSEFQQQKDEKLKTSGVLRSRFWNI